VTKNSGAEPLASYLRETQRLILAPLQPKHVGALHQFFTHADVRRYLWDDQLVTAQTVAEIVDASQRGFAQVGYGFYALYQQPNADKLIGFCGFRPFEETDEVELLYGVLPDYWGLGLVTEAARSALEHAFHDCHLERIVAATDTPNQRSVRVMQRLGMSFDDRREFHGLDTVFYSLQREAFTAVP